MQWKLELNKYLFKIIEVISDSKIIIKKYILNNNQIKTKINKDKFSKLLKIRSLI